MDNDFWDNLLTNGEQLHTVGGNTSITQVTATRAFPSFHKSVLGDEIGASDDMYGSYYDYNSRLDDPCSPSPAGGFTSTLDEIPAKRSRSGTPELPSDAVIPGVSTNCPDVIHVTEAHISTLPPTLTPHDQAIAAFQIQQLLASLQGVQQAAITQRQQVQSDDPVHVAEYNTQETQDSRPVPPVLQQLFATFATMPASRRVASTGDDEDDSDRDDDEIEEADESGKKRKRKRAADKSQNLTMLWHLINDTKLWVGNEGYFIFPSELFMATQEMFKSAKQSSTQRKLRKKGFEVVTRKVPSPYRQKLQAHSCWLVVNRRSLRPKDKTCPFSLFSPSEESSQQWEKLWSSKWPPRRNLAHKFSQEMLDTISEITDMFPMYSAPLPVPNRNVTITPTYQTSVGPIISCNQQNRSSTPNRVADLEDRASTQLAEVVVTQCARVEPTETGFASTAFLNESALSQDSTSNNTPKYISSSSSDFATVLCDSDDGVDPVDQPTPSGLESHRPATPIPSSPPNKMSSQQVLIVAQEAQVAAPTAPAPVRRRLTLFNASETQNRPTFRIARVFGHLAPIDLFESELNRLVTLYCEKIAPQNAVRTDMGTLRAVSSILELPISIQVLECLGGELSHTVNIAPSSAAVSQIKQSDTFQLDDGYADLMAVVEVAKLSQVKSVNESLKRFSRSHWKLLGPCV